MFEFSRHDFRLVIPVVLSWMVAAYLMSDLAVPRRIFVYRMLLIVCVLTLTALAVISVALTRSRSERRRRSLSSTSKSSTNTASHDVLSLFVYVRTYALLCVCIVMCVIVRCDLDWLRYNADVQSELSAMKSYNISAVVKITSPVLTTNLRGFKCSAQAQALSIQKDDVRQTSSMAMRIYGRSAAQCNLQRGAVYEVAGQLKKSEYIREKWMLQTSKTTMQTLSKEEYTNDSSGRVLLIQDTSGIDKAINFIQARFLEQTSQLDMQASIVVPGITIGVLGSDAYLIHEMNRDVSSKKLGELRAEAKRVKDAFRIAGIIHVLAVSGGHFALVISAVTWLLKRWKVHRWIRSLGVLCANCVVFAMMYPSDSTVRAFVMGFVVAGYTAMGRRIQGCASLCMAVIILLLVDPSYAISLGFSLSCAAVFGIIICTKPITDFLMHVLPRKFALPCAVTISANCATLPISIGIMPSIPVYAVISNMAVAIPMDIATVCGLCALSISWIFPEGGLVCAWIAGRATEVITQVCFIIQRLPFAQVTCTAEQLLGIYCSIGFVTLAIIWFISRKSKKSAFETRYRIPVKQRWNQYWSQMWRDTLWVESILNNGGTRV